MLGNLALSSECAVLFADLIGSSQLYERIGDGAAFALVDKCIKTMSRVIEKTGGRVVKNTGDGLMAAFWDADAAADAALAMQQQVRELPLVASFGLGVKVGFHFGPVVESGSDVFGETVNLCARLSELASPGQAITSRETAARLREGWQPLLRTLPPRPVKGMSRQIELCALLCDPGDEITAIAPDDMVPLVQAALRLYVGERCVVLDAERRRVRFGRDAGAEIVLHDPLASRRHAEIELRGEKFVLIDRSSNGTYVTFEEGKEFVLSREEVVLRGRGMIAFGQSQLTSRDAIRFVCL